jgi:hypothetical protein
VLQIKGPDADEMVFTWFNAAGRENRARILKNGRRPNLALAVPSPHNGSE